MSDPAIPFRDRFQATPGTLLDANGNHGPVTVSLYWSNSNPLAYVIGVCEDGGELEAWEVARVLFIAADHHNSGGGFVGGGDFAIGYNARTGNAVLYFKPVHEPPEKWVQVAVPAGRVRQFVDDTFKASDGYSERAVIARQVQRAIDGCLSDVRE